MNVDDPEYEYIYTEEDYEEGADGTESPMLRDGELHWSAEHV